MKFVIVFAALLAVSAAQDYRRLPQQYVRPTLPPSPQRIPVPQRPTPQAVVVNRVGSAEQTAKIIRYDSDIYPDGSYKYAFETDNGIAAQAEGVPRVFGGNPPVAPVVSQGSFSWTSPESQPIVISYVADENGYQPQGDAIPTPPPIPEAILKALEYIARNPPSPLQK